MDQILKNNLVRISRRFGLADIICYIHQSNNDYIIASELSDSLDLDGFCIFPTRLALCFDREFEKGDFYNAALGAWPSNNDGLKILKDFSCNLSIDLGMFFRRKELISVHMEIDDPDFCHIGIIKNIEIDKISIMQISSKGIYIDEPLDISFEEISKIEFGTRYLKALEYAAKIINK